MCEESENSWRQALKELNEELNIPTIESTNKDDEDIGYDLEQIIKYIFSRTETERPSVYAHRFKEKDRMGEEKIDLEE